MSQETITALILFFIVLGILWLLLPFAVFGIKKRLDTLIETSEGIKNYLSMLIDYTEKNNELTKTAGLETRKLNALIESAKKRPVPK